MCHIMVEVYLLFSISSFLIEFTTTSVYQSSSAIVVSIFTQNICCVHYSYRPCVRRKGWNSIILQFIETVTLQKKSDIFLPRNMRWILISNLDSAILNSYIIEAIMSVFYYWLAQGKLQLTSILDGYMVYWWHSMSGYSVFSSNKMLRN